MVDQAWVDKYYGPGYTADGSGGVQSVGSNGQVTMTHNKRTPETHPWLFINPGEVDVNGQIYDNASRTSRTATEAERVASHARNSYNTNPTGRLDPSLMRGMTRTMGQNNDTFRNKYGQYTQHNETYDPVTKKWTKNPSRFSGKDAQGKAVNWANTRAGQYGDGSVRTPDFANLGFNIYGKNSGSGSGSRPGGGAPGGPVPLPPGNGPQPLPGASPYIGMPAPIQVGGAAKAKQPWFHTQPDALAIQAAQAAALRTG
jgi:hypothetical protein